MEESTNLAKAPLTSISEELGKLLVRALDQSDHLFTRNKFCFLNGYVASVIKPSDDFLKVSQNNYIELSIEKSEDFTTLQDLMLELTNGVEEISKRFSIDDVEGVADFLLKIARLPPEIKTQKFIEPE
ncbi:hypothetical protein LFX25_20725 [Leptospira sp. FAT2]|uniref:hypothetical protein n=1 Tax=Leptospira sanjuanensis TaxID=2879643 RepID=UPI001EE8B39A|nr:hypothetical protein [Leptospira sanjuanensis]MCG6195671.1 hypothetical protein [Leptospira sanjuanensis]